MTIQDWGAIGEVVSAIAVLATLVYLAIQIRLNTAATKAQIHQSRSEQAQAYLLFGASSPELAEMIARARDNPETLSELGEGERQQIRFWAAAGMQRLQNMFFQKQSGFLSAELFANQERIIARLFPLWEALDVINDDDFGKEARRIYNDQKPQQGAANES